MNLRSGIMYKQQQPTAPVEAWILTERNLISAMRQYCDEHELGKSIPFDVACEHLLEHTKWRFGSDLLQTGIDPVLIMEFENPVSFAKDVVREVMERGIEKYGQPRIF